PACRTQPFATSCASSAKLWLIAFSKLPMANSASEFLPSTLDRFEPVAVVRQFQVGRNGAITATKNDMCGPKRLLFPEESFRFNGCAFHITFSPGPPMNVNGQFPGRNMRLIPGDWKLSNLAA